MNKYLPIIAIASMMITQSCLAVDLHGLIKVKTKGDDSPPRLTIENAKVETQSDSNGKFILTFKELAPGDQVSLELPRLGKWQVLHESMLKVTIPYVRKETNPPVIEIILCKLEECDEQRAEYFGLSKFVSDRVSDCKVNLAEKKGQLKSVQDILKIYSINRRQGEDIVAPPKENPKK